MLTSEKVQSLQADAADMESGSSNQLTLDVQRNNVGGSIRRLDPYSMVRQNHMSQNDEDETTASYELKFGLTHQTCDAGSAIVEVQSQENSLLSIPAKQSSNQTCAFSVYGQSWSCRQGCRCSCHDRKTAEMKFSLPSIVRNICGDVFGGYTGYPVNSTRCDNRNCLRRSQMRLRVVYLFPAWFLKSSIELLVKRSFSGITINLKICRVLQWESGCIFQYARDGNLQLLEQRLIEDPTCVNAQMETGNFPLDAALLWNRMDVARFLLRNGADPYIEGGRNCPSIARATQLVLSNSHSPEVCCMITELLPISAYIEEMGFSFLTKVVIGLCPIHLKSVLQSRDPSILKHLESEDESGRRPLHWAAVRNAPATARELLEAGADVNAKTAFEKRTPLRLAVMCRFRDATQLVGELLNAGADLEQTDGERDTIFSTHAKWATCLSFAN